MNRAEKRRAIRKVTKSEPRAIVRPSREVGWEVEVVDGKVLISIHALSTIVTTELTKDAAKFIAGMIEKAADETGEEMEVVTGSGLVVTKNLPT